MKFYLIDKPIGITSFDVIKKIQRKLQTKKVGHSGTLDPLATGCLLVSTFGYTKLLNYVNLETKEYEFEISLDGISESFDLGTEVLKISEEKFEHFKKTLTKEFLDNLIKKHFSGKIKQIPPKYSALKIKGQKALHKILNGENFVMPEREVEIFNIEIIDFSYPKIFLKAKVSAGTYVRSIAYYLGEMLGSGGYISSLRRTKIGNLDIFLAQDFESFDENNFLEIEKVFENEKFIELNFEELKNLFLGSFLEKDLENSRYFIKFENEIVGVGNCENGIFKMERGIKENIFFVGDYLEGKFKNI